MAQTLPKKEATSLNNTVADNRGQTTIYFAEPSSSRQRLKTNVMLTPLALLAFSLAFAIPAWTC